MRLNCHSAHDEYEPICDNIFTAVVVSLFPTFHHMASKIQVNTWPAHLQHRTHVQLMSRMQNKTPPTHVRMIIKANKHNIMIESCMCYDCCYCYDCGKASATTVSGKTSKIRLTSKTVRATPTLVPASNQTL